MACRSRQSEQIRNRGEQSDDAWLPETRKTLRCLERAIDRRAEDRTLILCEHLREGALTIGANVYYDLSNAIERAFLMSNFRRAQELIDDAKARATVVAA